MQANLSGWTSRTLPTRSLTNSPAAWGCLCPRSRDRSSSASARSCRFTGTEPCSSASAFLITLRRAPSPALEALRQGGSVHPQLGSDPIRALHPVISSLYAQFSALFIKQDERLDTLGQRVLREANDKEPAEITAIRHQAAVALGVGLSVACVAVTVVILSRRSWN
jgi:hypothetical protein